MWTDDTSMALLEHSIATFDPPGSGHGGRRSGIDAADQLDAYYRWWKRADDEARCPAPLCVLPVHMPALQRAPAADVPLPDDAAGDPAATEAHYTMHHRLLRLVGETLRASSLHPAASDDDDEASVEAHILALLPPAAALPLSGYVVNTLAAALYAFLARPTFEAGAQLAANMGNDTDTVAAVYGGLVGA